MYIVPVTSAERHEPVPEAPIRRGKPRRDTGQKCENALSRLGVKTLVGLLFS
jgi:hypothetical protein